MSKENDLLKKLTKAKLKQEELENDIKENKAKEEKHRKNALWTNVIVFIVHFIGFFVFPPIIVFALLYNLINMSIRAHLMFKAEDKQEKSQELLKKCKELINLYEKELIEECDFSKSSNSISTKTTELPLKPIKSEEKDCNKKR